MKVKGLQIVGSGNPNRTEEDFYPTPPFATQQLLLREPFDGSIWEPACGNGAMSEVLESFGYSVFSSDLYNRGYGYSPMDFLQQNKRYDNIITNPPYRLAQEFVEHALDLTSHKVAMLLKIQFLESASRYRLFKSSPLKHIYVFSKRLTLTQNGEKQRSTGLICFAWYVWEHGYQGKPTVDWIL